MDKMRTLMAKRIALWIAPLVFVSILGCEASAVVVPLRDDNGNQLCTTRRYYYSDRTDFAAAKAALEGRIHNVVLSENWAVIVYKGHPDHGCDYGDIEPPSPWQRQK